MKTVLITGATTGIGLATARLLLDKPYHLILTARESSLDRFSQVGLQENQKLWFRKLDLEDSKQRRAVIEEIDQTLGGVDVLINNAGISYRSVVEHVQEKERLHQMAVNFRAPLGLIRLVLPKMREKRAGRIINISSVGGMMAMPTMAAYSASKFALEGASESLYYEVKPWNIFVTLVQPGFINSDGFTKVPYTEESLISYQDKTAPYHNHYVHMSKLITRLMQRSPSTPDTVAKRIYKVMCHRSPPLRVTGTLDAFVFDMFRRVMPTRLYHWILYRSLPKVNTWGTEGEDSRENPEWEK